MKLSDLDIPTLLQHGQELYATAPSKLVEAQQDAHDAALAQMDAQAGDFVEARISQQRRILAERLGLASVQDILQGQGSRTKSINGRLGDELLSRDDIVSSYSSQPKRGRKRRRAEKSATEETGI